MLNILDLCVTYRIFFSGYYDPKRFRCRVHKYILHDDLIEPYLQQAGFGNVINIENYSMDYKFILALVERWRPETHTFHLPCGRMYRHLRGRVHVVGSTDRR